MKSAKAYKAVMYQHASIDAGFWLGRAIDKQVNSREVRISEYWISDFLDSDFRTTSAAGTRRLAIALREAAKNSDSATVKREIAAAVTLANSVDGQRMTIREFQEQFGLSDMSKDAVSDEIRMPNLLDDAFRFDHQEFSKQVAFRSIELDNGGVLTAESSEFDNVFRQEMIDEAENEVRISTEGRVVNERLRKSK